MASTPQNKLAGREIIVEIIARGTVLSIAAVDAATGVEAIASGPITAREDDVERLAVGKLTRRLEALGHLPAENQHTRNKRSSPGNDDGAGILV